MISMKFAEAIVLDTGITRLCFLLAAPHCQQHTFTIWTSVWQHEHCVGAAIKL